MLDLEKRTAILCLYKSGQSIRSIARAVKVSRNSVKKVIKSGQAEVPHIERQDQLTPHLTTIRELYAECKGNLVRVHEELESRHKVSIAYPTLTSFCRRNEIGVQPKKRSGRYYFKPGEEMQHDTSPHTVKIAKGKRKLHCASLVLCYSRMIFFQLFVTWRRFNARVFLTEALSYFGGSAHTCMLDNSTVIIAHGTGEDAVPAPEMVAFAERFNFTFKAHAVGDANRSARVERPFDYIEKNFYPGRTFASMADINRQARLWCDKVNRTYRRHLRAIPLELFALERTVLDPLPIYVPDVYDLHIRRVDVEGYVTVHTNRYSVPAALIGRQMQIHETKDHIRVFDGHQLVCQHDVAEPGQKRRMTLEQHRHPGSRARKNGPPLPHERVLRAASPRLSVMVDALRKKQGGRAARAIQQLHNIYLDYPTDAVITAVDTALKYGLLDMKRIEGIVLRTIAGDFFKLSHE
jgi:transposase